MMDKAEKDRVIDSKRRFLFKVATICGLGIMLKKLILGSAHGAVDSKYTNIMPNVKTSFNRNLAYPEINPTAYVHPLASFVGNNVFVGMQALVFKAVLGNGCVIEPGAKVVGVKIEDNRYVPMGTALGKQEDADNLPKITETYSFRDLNAGVVHVNVQLADGYNHKLPKELSGEG